MSEPTRRTFLATGAAITAAPALAADKPSDPRPAGSHQASGVKVGEVTDSTAIVWTRLTENTWPNPDGPTTVGKGRQVREHLDADEKLDPATLLGACPGMTGVIRIRYGTSPDDLSRNVDKALPPLAQPENDYTCQFKLTGLPSDTIIYYAVDTEAGPGSDHAPLTGQFRTAPKPTADVPVTFAVLSCQMFADLDHPDGFHIYPAMRELDPRFVAFTGDNVYYDNERPRAVTPGLARYHWERMYSLPRHIDLLRHVASYWEKDDHDTLSDDSWPGRKMGDLTFEEGQKIFRQQVPMGEKIYRTFRWGEHLQIWLTDGRDFRSPNTMKDGPDKTIWGDEQKQWLFRTLKESDATWKVLISPTPIVGPDRAKKSDNHANKVFQHEGDEIRAWFAANVPDNFFVVCGDRHWQYHSVHPQTGLHEFSVGGASNAHASGSPGEDPEYHKFHRVKGGFLSVTAGGGEIAFRHRDVKGEVVYSHTAKV